jgi:two-component system, OmpR family, phosphate regulon sensor histidine kinase PhoR
MRPGTRRASVFAFATFFLTLALAGFVEWRHRQSATAALESELGRAVEQLAPEAAHLLALPVAEADAEIRRWAAASGMRVTLIARDGRVIADSWTLPALLGRLENHAARPEIQAAAKDARVAIARRHSASTDRATVYAAREIDSGAGGGFLRVAREETRFDMPWVIVLGAALVAALVGRMIGVRERRRHAAVARHLLAWAELPPTADLAALAEEADRRFREQREGMLREVDATRAALSEVGEGVVMLDTQGIVRFVNPAATALLGDDLAVGHDLVEAARTPELVSAVAEVLKTGKPSHTSVSLANGCELAARICPVAHPVLAIAVVLRDTREQRQLERSRRALVADLAHELRTPLTVLAALAEEFRESGQEGELIATLERQVVRLRTFAEELEELAALESGQVRLHVETVDAGAVARQVVADLAVEAQAARVSLEVEGGAELDTDPVRLAQVLTNLVENSIRYNRPGGRVAVLTSTAGDAVVIRVEDNGIGIPAAEIPLVFQRFYRVHRGAAPKGGSGLGLAIVKHLMRALGGAAQLSSREGAGTTVTLSLPRKQPAGKADTTHTKS